MTGTTDRSQWQRNLDALRYGETLQKVVLALAGVTPIVIAAVILGVLAYESFLFFADPQEGVSLWDFLTQTEWSPIIGNPKRYGIIVLVVATFLVAAIAMVVAIPVGVLAAVFLAEYAPPQQRRLLKPALEALSGIPTVIYGYFALLVVTPTLRIIFPELSFNALSAGLVVGVLVAPTISSLSEEALRNVPNDLRLGAYGIGFTKSEAIVRVLLPAAAPGIFASIALALSRALGETMIVSIAAGQFANLTLNPLTQVETMTTFIIKISQGTVGFGELEFKTIFTVGMVLFLITLALNSIGNWLSRSGNQHISHLLDIKDDDPNAPAAVGQPSPAEPSRLGRDRLVMEPPPGELDRSPKLAQRRRLFERGFQAIALGAALTGIFVVAALLLNLFATGGANLSWGFITRLTSRDPEIAGILDPLMGTLWTIGLTALMALPIGIGAAVYLEEYLPNNWLTQLLDIHISNLAAVPTIIYGLLGLEVFARLLESFNALLSRWTGGTIPEGLVGGYTILSASLTLTAIVLPVLIVSARSALSGISEGLRQGGYGIGMTQGQMLRKIVLPAALPRMATGALLALSVAIGETAALVAVGAVTSVGFVPSLGFLPDGGGWSLGELWYGGVQSPYTTLPVQIFYWLQDPKDAVQANAATATIVLIGGVLILNVAAVLLRDFADRRTT